MNKIAKARALIASTMLPDVAAFAADDLGGNVQPTFDAAREQAVVIGSDVVSFGTGVDAEFRQAISDSALFCQLAAQHKVGAGADPMDFFDAYFDYMMGLGWLVQQRDTSKLDFEDVGADVHKAIIGVIEGFLAPIAGAAQAVLLVLNGLYQMNQSAPFITLFNKRSVHQKIGRFQFTYIRPDPEHGLLAEMAAFGLVAEDVITQILFFKLKKNKASVRRSLGKLSIEPATLTELRANLAGKVKAYRQSMIAEAELGPIPGD